ncbi:hypothetical protein QMT27_00865 [Cronobacter dublinensis]|uniref:hypothetical protein n=1 Tax=Cronobacter dublinensis TaxID=413497 RepID=UPI003ADD1621
MLGDVFSQSVAQAHLFDENAPRANGEALMSLMHKLNQQGRVKVMMPEHLRQDNVRFAQRAAILIMAN